MVKSAGFVVAAMAILAGMVMAAETKLTIQAKSPSVILRNGERALLEYRYEQIPNKPYVQHLYTPSGIDVVRDSAPDHKHHHGLMFAVGVNGVSYWEETDKGGFQKHRPPIQTRSDSQDGTVRAGFTDTLDWIAPKQTQPVLYETRQIDSFAAPDLTANLLSWRTTLSAAEASVTLSGSHYYGLGMRFPISMDHKGEFFTAKGKIGGEVVRGDEQLSPGDWCAVYGTIDGKPVTVAMFDHPDNLRKVLWFSMTKPFSYLSATLNYHRQSIQLEKDKPLSLCYGVAVWDGRVDPQTIEQTRRQWLKLENQFNKIEKAK
jgi:hypothetical protein